MITLPLYIESTFWNKKSLKISLKVHHVQYSEAVFLNGNFTSNVIVTSLQIIWVCIVIANPSIKTIIVKSFEIIERIIFLLTLLCQTLRENEQ